MSRLKLLEPHRISAKTNINLNLDNFYHTKIRSFSTQNTGISAYGTSKATNNGQKRPGFVLSVLARPLNASTLSSERAYISVGCVSVCIGEAHITFVWRHKHSHFGWQAKYYSRRIKAQLQRTPPGKQARFHFTTKHPFLRAPFVRVHHSFYTTICCPFIGARSCSISILLHSGRQRHHFFRDARRNCTKLDALRHNCCCGFVKHTHTHHSRIVCGFAFSRSLLERRN